MNKNFGLLFYLKKSKINSSGLVPVYLRITIDGMRTDISSKRFVDANKWNNKAQKVTGTCEEIRNINSALKSLEIKVYKSHMEMVDKDLSITSDNLKRYIFDDEVVKIEITEKTILEVFKSHNLEVETLIGKGFAKGTLQRYEVSYRHTEDFMLWKYGLKDVLLSQVDHEFITSYDYYLRSVRNCANNSTIKYIKNFKKIVLISLANGWLEKNPFLLYKAKLKPVVRQFLNMDEIQRMADHNFKFSRLSHVRDIFLFCCFTGLCYADVSKLKKSEIITDDRGEKWISTYRKKTDTVVKVPLLPMALEIMSKYSDHPSCSEGNSVLPVSSNQKTNNYLKEIATSCEISKELTFHIARHTFATTVTLANGVPIESVSKMLGHTDIKTTQHYAKILDLKLSQDMALLKIRLADTPANKPTPTVVKIPHSNQTPKIAS
ncbi:integrase [Pedobacter cryoconitis]|uniref:site-specific integrase n=1 Tax=Pedobacter cryoconitis TaxID=188932 RepID=UPI00160C1F45|nr:site-specific integrase [Pedobacter cryoconitis]MBB6271183.1 integrase [Pedobacter cryoconitis]